MKLALYAICAIVAVVGGIGCTTGGGTGVVPGQGGVVAVQYVSPQTFTDFSVQGRNVRSSTSVFTQEVTRTLEPVMRRRFPGDVLTLRFTDIDLGGRRSASRPGSVRILRPDSPPGSHSIICSGINPVVRWQAARKGSLIPCIGH